MRAVWYERQGPARAVLEFGEQPKPTPGRGEALIRVHASGVNPSDAGMRRGVAGPMAYPRIIPHSDGAGVVEDVGPGAPRALIGQRVWFYNGQRNGRAFGSGADYIELDVDLVSPLPDGVSFEEGATLGIPGMTAHVALFLAGPVQGRVVLVTGGAGAVGHYAVQLARWAGAVVIATVSSPAKAERAMAGGAHHVIDYRRQDVAAAIEAFTGGEGVDHVVDVDLGGNLATTLPALKSGGMLAYYASLGDQTPKLAAYELMRRNASVAGVVLPTSPHPARRRAQADITRWIATGQRMLLVASVHPLEDAAAAHEAVERGDKVGTVVVSSA